MLYNIYNLVDHDKDFDVVKHACRPVNKILPPLEQNLDVDPTCHAASIYDFCSRLKVQQVLKCVKLTLSCLRRLFTFLHHYASCKVSCGMLTKVCRACINFLKLSCFFCYPLMVWSYVFTIYSQGGKKVCFRNTFMGFLFCFSSQWAPPNQEWQWVISKSCRLPRYMPPSWLPCPADTG